MAERKPYLFDNPRNIKRVIYALYAICAVLVLLDFIVHRHITHEWEGLLGFYAIYGFSCYVFIVLGAKWLRTIVMRDEDYYERDDARSDGEGEGRHVDG
jgi:hypothetical protein